MPTRANIDKLNRLKDRVLLKSMAATVLVLGAMPTLAYCAVTSESARIPAILFLLASIVVTVRLCLSIGEDNDKVKAIEDKREVWSNCEGIQSSASKDNL